MELEALIAEVISEHTAIVCQRVEALWGNMVGIEGNAEIHGDLPVIVGSMVTATLEATGQKAWIAEFGSGSLMDKDSPYLADYINNPNYNPVRLSDGSITGRPKGEYLDLDGNTQYSSGRNAGKDLELKPVYTVMYPQHTIRYEVEQEIPEIVAHIQEVIKNFTLQQLTMSIQIYL